MSLTFSNSPLWANCSASVSPRREGFDATPEEPTEAQQEGVAAAWMADCVLRGSAASCAEFEGEHAPNGWPVDYAMMRHVQGYVDTVRKHGRVHSETTLTLWNGLVQGRSDAHALDTPGDQLRLWDLKYGYRTVEPQDNPQLLLPAIALLQPYHKLITMAIYQPRALHPGGIYRKWTIDRATLKNHEQRLYAAAIATMDANPRASCGHHCTFCPRNRPSDCPTLAMNLAAQFELMSSTRRNRKLTTEELAAQLDFLDMVEDLLKASRTGTEAEAQGRIKADEQIMGWCMAPRAANRVIHAKPEIVQALTGLNPFQEPKMKTPAALEREGAHPVIIDSISHTPFAGYELKRWNPATVLKAFNEKPKKA
jgi:hypothetical protein